MEAELGRDPGERHDDGEGRDGDPDGIASEPGREGGARVACGPDSQREGEGYADRRDRVHRPGIEVVLIDDAGNGEHRAERDRRPAEKPGPTWEGVERKESHRDRRARDRREAQLDERAAQPTLEALVGDVVELVEVEDGVDDQDGEHVRGEEGPNSEGLALGRAAPHYSSAARRASAT